MEEVDGIIVHSLRQIGCELDDNVRRIGQFTTDQVVDAAARCLRRCSGGSGTFDPSSINIPGDISTIPMTSRLRIATSLAQACQELDYPGEVGYQTLLYWDESDIRRLFMFLIERMPKETEKGPDEPLGIAAILDASIAVAIKRSLTVPWLPKELHFKDDPWTEEYSRTRPFRSCHLTYPKKLKMSTKGSNRFYMDHLDFVDKQPTSSLDVISSVIEANGEIAGGVEEWETDLTHSGTEREFLAKKRLEINKQMAGYVQRSLTTLDLHSTGIDVIPSVDIQRLVISPKSSQQPMNTEDTEIVNQVKIVDSDGDEEAAQQKRIEIEYTKLEKLGAQVESLLLDNTRLDVAIRQIVEQTTQIETDTERLESALGLRKRTLALLPDADSNVARLQLVIEASVVRLQALASQWEDHRLPMINRYRMLKETSASRVSETQRKLTEIRVLREKMKDIADDARTKGEVYRQLTVDYEKMTKDFNRSAYTRRILEIVANIKKQKLDIDKVLIDTREVQKEINQLSGMLDRTFAVTDELVFKDAKKDEAVRKAYKYLAALHENCSLLVKTVEETGAIMREIRDLEDQIENENHNKVLANLERISADYKQMKQENMALVAKIRAANPRFGSIDEDGND